MESACYHWLARDIRLQPINCFFESINVHENVSNSLVALRVKDTTYGISNQLEFIQGGIPAVMVHLLHVGDAGPSRSHEIACRVTPDGSTGSLVRP